MEAQESIAEVLTGYGVSDAQIEAALTAADAADPEDEQADPYLPMLERYVAALGGQLEPRSAELRAVFPDVTVRIARS
jgi:hypothetical protein